MLKRPFIFLIKLYQKYISPLHPGCCRFRPTCSQYAIEALAEWGLVVGGALAIWRILRCNPFSRGGYDPVPVRKNRTGDSAPAPKKNNQNGSSVTDSNNKE